MGDNEKLENVSRLTRAPDQGTHIPLFSGVSHVIFKYDAAIGLPWWNILAEILIATRALRSIVSLTRSVG